MVLFSAGVMAGVLMTITAIALWSISVMLGGN